jgi:hypothetical protein
MVAHFNLNDRRKLRAKSVIAPFRRLRFRNRDCDRASACETASGVLAFLSSSTSILFLIVVSSFFALQVSPLSAAENDDVRNLIQNGQFEIIDRATHEPAGFTVAGNVAFGNLSDSVNEYNGHGFRLLYGAETAKPNTPEGKISTTVTNLRPQDGRWFRLRIRGLAQDNFRVGENDLYLKVQFFRDGGKNSLDHITKPIYGAIVEDRKALTDAGTNKKLGHAVWRSFDLDFHTPFPEVDTLTITVGVGHGEGMGPKSEFWINQMQLTAIPVPADYTPPKSGRISLGKEAISNMVALGGRWYFDPRGGNRTPPAQFDHTNADRLLYLSDRLEAPFQDNTSAWLRKGYLDLGGNLVKEDKFEPDNVTISFTKTHLVMHTKCLPNHPTAVFPDITDSLDGNPNYIQEKDVTFSIPLQPKENPQHVAMKDGTNANGALPRGPIGVAVNGIVFFNPFDQGGVEAIGRLDRCCGHPSPNAMYHYHKYPVCVKSPWADDGAAHSPLIGFAFDGYPIYGPYESQGILAKDDHAHPLNDFNIHYDDERGWHYHVTPGQFPHIIGGYWGVAEVRRPQGPPPQGSRPGRP